MTEAQLAAEGSAQRGPRTYGNWRKPTTPGLFSLGLVPTIGVFASLVLVVLIAATGGLLSALVAAAIAVVVVGPACVRGRSGRNGWQVLAGRVLWVRGRRKRQHLYRSGLIAPLSFGTHRLPGLLAASECWAAQDAYGLPFAMLRIPATRTWAVVLRVDPEGSALVDQHTTDTWVALWGRWLAELAHEPSLLAASATVQTSPDPGTELSREVERLLAAGRSSQPGGARGVQGAPALAAGMLAEAAGSWAAGSATVTGWVALTFDGVRRQFAEREPLSARRSKSGGAGNGDGTGEARSRLLSAEEMAVLIGSRLPGLVRSLHATGAGGGARAMTVPELTDLVRTAYDPAAGPVLAQLRADGVDPEVGWADAGPVACDEGFEQVLHDSGRSVTWQMVNAPRGQVQSQVLTPLLEPHQDLTCKRVTLLFRPLPPSSAARTVDSDVRTALGRATQRKGENRATDTHDLAAARQTAAEEAAGAGLVQFGLLVTATVPAEEPVAQAASVVEQAAGASRLRLRRCYGSQSASFAAGLGIGLIPGAHVQVPAILRDYL